MCVLAALILLGVGCGTEATPPSDPTPPAASLYDVPVRLVDPAGRPAGLDAGRGHPVLASMFYTSCPAACPMLISRIQGIEAALPADRRADLRVLLVTVDPARDTPHVLARVQAERRLDPRWSLLTGDEDAVRRAAAALGFSYRRRADGDFDHSSTLVLLDRDGVERARADATSGTDGLVAALKAGP